MKNYVICLGRQFCSGGKEIGKMLSERLGIDFYDAQLLRQRAKEMGIEDSIFDMFDEKPSRSFLFSVVMDPYAIDSAVDEGKVVEAQRKVMSQAAEKGPCIIVGRRADKILEKNYNVVSIFIGADIEHRVKRYLERESMSEKAARRFIERKDRERASYYNYLGDGNWSKADNYMMCFNTSKLGKEKIVDMIVNYINEEFGD
ncbi:MAG: cytidylate kinase-like family protein [Eubacterium sp.]|nr:cytidylate kinase-like family protein [Eubacterium sp.]